MSKAAQNISYPDAQAVAQKSIDVFARLATGAVSNIAIYSNALGLPSGYKFRLKWVKLRAYIGTVLGTSVAGQALWLHDGALATTTKPILTLGIITGTAQAAGPWFGATGGDADVDEDFAVISGSGPSASIGKLSAAANNALNISLVDNAAAVAAGSIASGLIVIAGQIGVDDVAP